MQHTKRLLSILLAVVLLATATIIPVNADSYDSLNSAGQAFHDPDLHVQVSDISTTSAKLDYESNKTASTFKVTLYRENHSWVEDNSASYDAATRQLSGLSPDTHYKALVTESYVDVYTYQPYIRAEYSRWGYFEYYYYYVRDNDNTPKIRIAENKIDKTGHYWHLKAGIADYTKEFPGSRYDFDTFKTQKLAEYELQVNVAKGGIAVVKRNSDSTEVAGNGNKFKLTEGTAVTITAYSNAGYEALGFLPDNTDTVIPGNVYNLTMTGKTTIGVGFKSVADVHSLDYYVTNGYFSGYKGDGKDITTNDDPRGDLLGATLSAKTNKDDYTLSEDATVTVTATVTDGDDNTKTLKEVDFYADEQANVKNIDVTDKYEIPYTYSIPSSKESLDSAGYKLSATGFDAYTLFEKKVNFEMVDRYDGQDAAASMAKASATIPVKVVKLYEVTTTVENSGTADPASKFYTYGQQATVHASTVAKDGYTVTFDGWYVKGEKVSTEADFSFNVKNNDPSNSPLLVFEYGTPLALTAKFKEEPLLATLDLQKYIGSGTDVGVGFTFTLTQMIMDTAPKASAESFLVPAFPLPLVTDETGHATAKLPNGAYLLTEQVDPSLYTNDLPKDGLALYVKNGEITLIDKSVLEGNRIVVRNTPVVKASAPIVTNQFNSTQTNVGLNLTIDGPGKVFPGTNAFGLDSIVNFSITPDEGYVFLGWDGKDKDSVKNDSIVMSESRTLIARFGLKPAETTIIQEPATLPASAPEAPATTPAAITDAGTTTVIAPVTVPQSAPQLPKTGGIPMGLLSGIGALLASGGLILRRKKHEDEQDAE